MDNSSAPTISHKQLGFSVAERLRTDILEGKYPPGDWLRQEKLAQEYGVSQMPIREAFKILEAEGLLEHVPYHGVQVIDFVIDDIADLYDARAYFESKAARAAAAIITRSELDELHQLYQNMRHALAPEDLPLYRQLNKTFHLNIAAASKHKYLIRTITQMWKSFPSMLWSNFLRTATSPLPERDMHDTDEHLALLQALENHDPDQAETVARRHIEAAGNDLIRVLRSSQK